MPTVEQLKARAKRLGISGYSKLKKAQLEKLVAPRKNTTRVPQYTAPLARGRSSSPRRVPQYTVPTVRRRTSPPRPPPPTAYSHDKYRFIQMSLAAGVPKAQAEHNWLLTQTEDDDDELLSLDFRRHRR